MAYLTPRQQAFVDFLVEAEAVRFGEFKTKSGRKSPYFINTGAFHDGKLIARLGAFYAAHAAESGLAEVEVVFGPAYKGIPLAVATAEALAREYQQDVSYAFDRKEVKDHGDGGGFVGAALEEGTRVLIVEDVVTAGTTLSQIVPMLRKTANVHIAGILIAVDRRERAAKAEEAAVDILARDLALPIAPIVTIHHILERCREHGILDEDGFNAAQKYLKRYGA